MSGEAMMAEQRDQLDVLIPPEVRLALRVLLNHVEPGWENCATIIRMWLNVVEADGDPAREQHG